MEGEGGAPSHLRLLFCKIVYIVNSFLELTVPSFIIRLEDVENGATCLEIAMEIPKIVLNTFNGKGHIKENVFVLIPFPTLILDQRA